MAQHDYNIANQTAPAFRTDLNNALAALASTSSGATAPATTYANMLWYDTAANILKMRNEADSAWINLLALDQGANTAQPSTLPFSSQSQAEIGTNNTTVMTPLRTAQAITALAPDRGVGVAQTWTDVSGSRVVNTSYQNTTVKPIMVSVSITGGGVGTADSLFQCSTDNATWVTVSGRVDSTGISVIVPATHYYRLRDTSSTLPTILFWAELR